MYDIIIIGAGPAGLTAALYALRANKKVLVLEAKNYGGQIIDTNIIENYPGIQQISGIDYANDLYRQVEKLGLEIKYETVIKIQEDKTVITEKNEYKTKTVIIATGSQKRKLNIEDEFKFLGKGISYCATCDGSFYKEKIVAVVGGGDVALHDALYLSNIASKVYLIHRRDEFRGQVVLLNKIKEKKNIEIIYNSNICKLKGENKLESIDIKDELNKITNINVSSLFVAIGQEPRNEMFINVVDLDEKGYILFEKEVNTKTKGIYVAGDARSKTLRQLTTAVSDGSIAAVTAIKEMNNL